MNSILFQSTGVFTLKVPLRRGIYLSGLLGIRLNLRRVVLFMDILSLMISLSPFWCNTYNFSSHGINLCPYHACNLQSNLTSPKENTNILLTLPVSTFPLACSRQVGLLG